MSYGYVDPVDGFTIELWFQHAAVPTTSEALVSQQTQNANANWSTVPGINGRQFVIWLSPTTGPGALSLEIRSESGSMLLTYSDTGASYAADSRWHFMAFSMDATGAVASLYIDDALTTHPLSMAIDWQPGALSFGGAYAPHLGNWGDFFFNGGLSYIAVWDEALTDAQIRAHKAAGLGEAAFANDTEVQRLERILSYAGVPPNSQRLDPPVSTLQGAQIANQHPLDLAQSAANAAGGLFFADGQATVVYQNRHYRYGRQLRATLAESTASAPEVGMGFSTDDTKVYNDIQASRPNGGSIRVRNTASQDEYGPKTYTLNLPITSDDELLNAATWVAERYGSDMVRISGVTLQAHTSDLIQYLAETVQIGDRIAFDELPQNAPESYVEYIVEGIGVSASLKDQTWTLSLELSPAELWNVLQVGVSTLGDGSRLAY